MNTREQRIAFVLFVILAVFFLAEVRLDEGRGAKMKPRWTPDYVWKAGKLEAAPPKR